MLSYLHSYPSSFPLTMGFHFSDSKKKKSDEEEEETAADINRKHDIEPENHTYKRSNSSTARDADEVYEDNRDTKPYIDPKDDAEDTKDLPG